jgi:hypothetical protein
MKFIQKMLSTHYSIPTFVWVIVSLVLAGVVGAISFAETPNAFIENLPFDGKIWAISLGVANLLTAVGMVRDTTRKWFIRTGSFASFCLWIFGTISFAQDGGIFIPILSAPLMIVFAYVYLASLERKDQL